MIKQRLGNLIHPITDYHANGSYKVLKENVTLKDTEDYALMIRTTNFEQDDFKTANKFIDRHAYEYLKKSKVLPGDIIMNKIANAGSVYLMPDLGRPVSLAMNLFLIRPDSKKVNPAYIYLFLKQNEKYVKSFAQGSVTLTITKDAVRNLEILLPDRDTQDEIVNIFEIFDSKIETNKKINETLEEIAKTLFKSWFINFDPVRAKAEGRSTGLSKEISDLFHDSFEDSELGEIPKGWKVKKVGECLEFIYGKGLTKKQRIHGDIPVYGSNGIVGFHNSSNARGPGIVVGRAGNPGTVHWSFKDFYVIDSAFSVNVIDDEMSNFYFFALKKLCLERLDSGSAIPGLNRNHAYEEKTIIPNLSLLREFNEQSSRFFNKQLLNLEENEVLSQLRDTLLPKLISGEIQIPDAQQIVEEAGV